MVTGQQFIVVIFIQVCVARTILFFCVRDENFHGFWVDINEFCMIKI